MAHTAHKAPSFKKPKALKALKGWGKAEKLPPLPDLDAGPERVASLVDDELARLTNALGDSQLAKRILKLKKKYPDGTTLELAIMDWFDRKRIRYFYQQWLLGGRILKGGQVVDFIIEQGARPVVIEAQGNYWHTRPGLMGHDEAQRFALLGTTFHGKKIGAVIEVWESRIMTPNKSMRERTMQLALQGIEVGK